MESVKVSLLSRNVNEAHLNEIFARYGEVKAACIKRESKSGYVKYDNPESASKAVKCMNGGQIDGVVVDVRAIETYPDDVLSNIHIYAY